MAYSSTRSSQGKVMINFCSAQELMVLPRVGKKIAKTVVKFRDFTGNITPDNIFDINKLNLSDEVLNMIDFTPNVDYDKDDSTMKTEDVSRSGGSKAEDPRVFQERMLRLIAEKSAQHKGDREEGKTGPPRTGDSSRHPQVPNRPERNAGSRYGRRAGEEDSEEEDLIRRPTRERRRSELRKRQRPAYSPGCTPTHLQSEEELDEDDDDDEVWGRRRSRSNFKPAALPKSLTYDGKSNWLAFKRKFVRYAAASKWTEAECLDALCWCLVSKASDFYALSVERNDDMTFFELMGRLEKRLALENCRKPCMQSFHRLCSSRGKI